MCVKTKRFGKSVKGHPYCLFSQPANSKSIGSTPPSLGGANSPESLCYHDFATAIFEALTANERPEGRAAGGAQRRLLRRFFALSSD
jgi:hypothetical protein